jgi:hypothetical protein
MANPANTPPSTTPTTPGPLAAAAPVLCAGAEAEEIADAVLEAEVDVKTSTDELELRDNVDVVMVVLCDIEWDAVIVPLRDVWIDVEPVPETRCGLVELTGVG